MILYPAIDLKDGACVRLLRGAMDRATRFNDDPAGQAETFASAGAAWLHVVDLDGAVAGRSMNEAAIGAILDAVDIPVQLGGGIRELASIEAWLARGVARVILGTVAITDPELVDTACARFPGRIAVAIDARAGRAARDGWTETSTLAPADLSKRAEEAGAAAIIYTDIERDGAMTGVNVGATAALAEPLSTPVIASGGVAALDDLRALKRVESAGIEGVICGRALYAGGLDLGEALRLLAGDESC